MKTIIDYWFKSNNKELIVNMDNIKTTFEDTFNETKKSNFDIVESKNNITYALKNDELLVYGIKPKEIVNEFDELLAKIDKNITPINLPNNNWDKIELVLTNPITNSKTNKTWINITKDSIYTYPIKVNSFGEYIIDLEISSNEESIHQMPFSIYVDNINKQTITTNGTNGKIIKASGQVIIEPNNKYLSFKFHKTGINVYSIKVTKHG